MVKNKNVMSQLWRGVIASALIYLLTACTGPSGASTVSSGPSATTGGGQTIPPLAAITTPTPSGGQAMQNAAQAVRLDGDAIAITNFTGKPLYYAAFPVELLATIEWAPCAQASECPEAEIQPAQTARVPLSVVQRPATTTVAVFTWHIESQANGGRTYATQPTRTDVQLP